MEAMLNVKLDADLVENLERATAEQGVTVEQAIDEMARKYIAAARRKIIDREFEHYQRMHAELKQKYLDENVAIHQGQVVDHDADARALVRRLQKRFGRIPILFIRVESEPIPEYVIRSPRLVKDVLNKLPLFLDGPEQQTDLLDDAAVRRLRTRRT